MKKLLLFTLIFPVIAFSQKKQILIDKNIIGPLECQYKSSVDLEKGDTTLFILISFQNRKYTSITDFKYLAFYTQKDTLPLYSLIRDLKKALPEMGSKQSIAWSRERYGVALYDFSNDLYLSQGEKEGTGYTSLNKKEVEKLIFWFEKNGFKI